MISSCGTYGCASTLAGTLRASGATAPVVTIPVIGNPSNASSTLKELSFLSSKTFLLQCDPQFPEQLKRSLYKIAAK
jgi:hypothetical protein